MQLCAAAPARQAGQGGTTRENQGRKSKRRPIDRKTDGESVRPTCILVAHPVVHARVQVPVLGQGAAIGGGDAGARRAVAGTCLIAFAIGQVQREARHVVDVLVIAQGHQGGEAGLVLVRGGDLPVDPGRQARGWQFAHPAEVANRLYAAEFRVGDAKREGDRPVGQIPAAPDQKVGPLVARLGVDAGRQVCRDLAVGHGIGIGQASHRAGAAAVDAEFLGLDLGHADPRLDACPFGDVVDQPTSPVVVVR